MEDEIVIYHNNKCSKSREAKVLLEENDIHLEVVEYLKVNLEKKDLIDLLKKLNISALALMRKGEIDFKENVKGKTLSEDELVDLLLQFPKLIERPIIVKGNKAIIGRPTSLVLDFAKG
jgi:arsenate reductase (glutaredoxin)